ncbi:DNA ligase D-like protein (predicted polymerase) [Catenulispora sp. GP43]
MDMAGGPRLWPGITAVRAPARSGVRLWAPGRSLPTMGSAEAHVEAGGRSVRISSPDKLLFPDAGVTKLGLATYYASVADGLFRGLADRPVALNRFPDGLGGKSFFTKAAPKGLPDWASTARVTFPSGRTGDEVCITEPATALWTVQMGTLELHGWPVRAADTDHPDELRIDLDPQPGTDFAEAVQVAGPSCSPNSASGPS